MEHLTVKMRIKGAYRDMNPKEKQIADNTDKEARVK